MLFRSGDVLVAEAATLSAKVALGGALREDTLFYRLALGREKTDGYVDNTATGDKAAFRDVRSVRGTLTYGPQDSAVRVDLSGYYNGQNNAANGFAMVPTVNTVRRTVTLDPQSVTEFETYGGNVRALWEISDNQSITSITSFDVLNDINQFFDVDYSELDIIALMPDSDSKTFAQELRYRARMASWAEVLTGAFYTEGDRHTVQQFTLFGTLLQDLVVASTFESSAAFMNLRLTPLEQLELELGMRYDETRRQAVRTNRLSGARPATLSASEDVWQPKVAATYHWTDDVMTYASAARGYRTGGFNSPSLGPGNLTYLPERTWNYEIGLKGSWFGGRLSGAANIFYVDDDDAQIEQLLVTPNGAITSGTTNAGKLIARGVEIDFAARLGERLSVRGGYSLNEFDIDGGLRLIGAEERKLILSGRFEQPLAASVRGVVLLDYNAFGPVWFSNTEQQERKSVVDLQIGAEIGEHLQIFGFVKNALDEEYFAVYSDPGPLPTAPEMHLGMPADPRQMGVRVSFSY